MGLFNDSRFSRDEDDLLLLRNIDISPMVNGNSDVVFVDAVNGNDANDGRSWESAKQTIQAGVNLARYLPGTTTIDDTKDHHAYVFVAPGQYNEQVLFSGFNIHLIGMTGGNELSNKDYGVTINYDGAVAATCVLGFTGAGIEIANITIHCNQAIPAMYIPSPGDGCLIRNCYFTGNDAKTSTYAIQGDIKTSVIRDCLIEGFTTGIEIGGNAGGGGAWAYNSRIQGNFITKCTNGILIPAGAVAGQTMVLDNVAVGSSCSITNSTATDVVIASNLVKPAVSDGGAASGDNTTLA